MPVITFEIKRHDCVNPFKSFKCSINQRKWCFQINGLNPAERIELRQKLKPMKWFDLNTNPINFVLFPGSAPLYFCPCDDIYRCKQEAKDNPELQAKAAVFLNEKQLPTEIITIILNALEFMGYRIIIPTPNLHNHSSTYMPIQIWTLRSDVPDA